MDEADLLQDPALDEVEDWFRSQADVVNRLRQSVRRAIDEVIDMPRTGRFSVEQLNKQEKAYIGTKVEIVLRSEFDFSYPGAGHKDYQVAGHEVDCKWSGDWGGWQIPREQYGHLCLLVHARDATNELAVGLIRTRAEYITTGTNQDKKSTIRASDRDKHTRWLIPRSKLLPINFLLHLPDEDRKAILGATGGIKRAFELYSRCEGMVISRHVMASVGQQQDSIRRFRGGRGGVRPLLEAHGWKVINGTWRTAEEDARQLGGTPPPRHGSICLHEDGQSVERAQQRFGNVYRLHLEATDLLQRAGSATRGGGACLDLDSSPSLKSPVVDFEAGEASEGWSGGDPA